MKYTHFGEVSLEYYNEVTAVGSGKAPASNTPLPGGGSIDNFGEKQTHSGATKRAKKFIAIKRTEAELQIELNKMKKLEGMRAKLSRVDLNGDNSFQYARLRQVKITQKTKDKLKVGNKIQGVQLDFVCESSKWLGDYEGAWKVNDGHRINDDLVINGGDYNLLTTTPQDIDITIDQNSLLSKINSRGPKFTITAPVGSSFSSIVIANSNGGSLTFTGTVAAGKILVIDCASLTVLNDGVDAYDDLAVVYNTEEPHTWFTLFVGLNTLTVTHDGAYDIKVEYFEEHV